MKIYRVELTSIYTQKRYAETVSEGEYFSSIGKTMRCAMGIYLDRTSNNFSTEDITSAFTMLEDGGKYLSKTFYDSQDVEKDIMLSIQIAEIEVS